VRKQAARGAAGARTDHHDHHGPEAVSLSQLVRRDLARARSDIARMRRIASAAPP